LLYFLHAAVTNWSFIITAPYTAGLGRSIYILSEASYTYKNFIHLACDVYINCVYAREHTLIIHSPTFQRSRAKVLACSNKAAGVEKAKERNVGGALNITWNFITALAFFSLKNCLCKFRPHGDVSQMHPDGFIWCGAMVRRKNRVRTRFACHSAPNCVLGWRKKSFTTRLEGISKWKMFFPQCAGILIWSLSLSSQGTTRFLIWA
jgi:hypothetical protein